MKKKNTFLILTLAAGLFGALAFAADKSGGNPTKQSSPDHQTPADGAAELKAFHEKALATYDVDKNGTLDRDESAVLHADVRSGKYPVPAAVRQYIAQAIAPANLTAEMLATYDTNKDGKLDAKEHVALAADILSGKVQPPHPLHAAPPAGEKKAAPGS